MRPLRHAGRKECLGGVVDVAIRIGVCVCPCSVPEILLIEHEERSFVRGSETLDGDPSDRDAPVLATSRGWPHSGVQIVQFHRRVRARGATWGSDDLAVPRSCRVRAHR